MTQPRSMMPTGGDGGAEARRFTRDGGPVLEARLAAACERARSGVARVIPVGTRSGLVLGGGYGRGEGGVLRPPGTDAGHEEPYNDLEFYVFTRGSVLWNQRRFGPSLHALSEQLAREIGIDVEFKLTGVGTLRRAAPSMFHYDLVARHRRIEGGPDLLQECAHHADASAIPGHEATRLLMNRGAGLLFAGERLAEPRFRDADADFVGRNLAKAALALGDAVLAAQGRYHWSCLERHQRLLALPAADLPPVPVDRLVQLHEEGVGFKLHPLRSKEARERLETRSRELVALLETVWSWIETRRLGGPRWNPREYALQPRRLLPDLPAWRNRLVNARAFGWSGLLAADGNRHPRERLLRALPLLLFPDAGVPDADTEAALDGCLGVHARDRRSRIAAFRGLWQRFG